VGGGGGAVSCWSSSYVPAGSLAGSGLFTLAHGSFPGESQGGTIIVSPVSSSFLVMQSHWKHYASGSCYFTCWVCLGNLSENVTYLNVKILSWGHNLGATLKAAFPCEWSASEAYYGEYR